MKPKTLLAFIMIGLAALKLIQAAIQTEATTEVNPVENAPIFC